MGEVKKGEISQEEFDDIFSGSSQAKKETFFKPGKYDVVVKKIEDAGAADNDKGWRKLRVTFGGTDEREIRTTLMFPANFKDLKYGKNQVTYPAKKLREFVRAVGEEFDKDTYQTVLKKVFGKPDKLVNKPLSVRIGYERAKPRFVSRDKDTGVVTLNIELKDGTLLQENGVVVTITGADSKTAHQSAVAYATSKKLPYDSFAQVCEFFPAAENAAADDVSW